MYSILKTAEETLKKKKKGRRHTEKTKLAYVAVWLIITELCNSLTSVSN